MSEQSPWAPPRNPDQAGHPSVGSPAPPQQYAHPGVHPAGYWPAPGAGGGYRNGVGTASMVLGIISMIFGGALFGIPAIITGFIGRARVKSGEANNSGQVLTGLITGFISTLIITPLIMASIALPLFLDQRAGTYDAQVKVDLAELAAVADTSYAENESYLDAMESAPAMPRLHPGTVLSYMATEDGLGYCISGYSVNSVAERRLWFDSELGGVQRRPSPVGPSGGACEEPLDSAVTVSNP